uniref:uncharacterized protein n=1 Tax=Myxine glutinosa TaxID=7769 RepID=UPI00358DDF8B
MTQVLLPGFSKLLPLIAVSVQGQRDREPMEYLEGSGVLQSLEAKSNETQPLDIPTALLPLSLLLPISVATVVGLIVVAAMIICMVVRRSEQSSRPAGKVACCWGFRQIFPSHTPETMDSSFKCYSNNHLSNSEKRRSRDITSVLRSLAPPQSQSDYMLPDGRSPLVRNASTFRPANVPPSPPSTTASDFQAYTEPMGRSGPEYAIPILPANEHVPRFGFGEYVVPRDRQTPQIFSVSASRYASPSSRTTHDSMPPQQVVQVGCTSAMEFRYHVPKSCISLPPESVTPKLELSAY